MTVENKLIRNWLILAVSSIAIAGIYSLPPLILRGPFFKSVLPVEEIFASSLVIHVNLSVLVWMLAVGGMLWSHFCKESEYNLYKSVFYAACLGTFFIAISPFTGDLEPIKNNYVPVLQNPLFFIGLGIFASAIIIKMLLITLSYQQLITSWFGYGLYSAALITITAGFCFIIAAFKAPMFDYNNPLLFYEFIFWGGGHILQSTYTALLIITWFILLKQCGYKNLLKVNFIYILFGFNLLTCIVVPFFYFFENHYELFSAHMRNFMGIAPLIAAIAVIYSILKNKSQIESQLQINKIAMSFLLFSIFLFGYGGILGHMIRGIDVTIPAHYHGSIVGITLSFMGIIYIYMDKVGFKTPEGFLAKSQPYIYGVGQTLHITGLAVMGGYGALRKSAASSHNIDTMIGKSLFFCGGTLAILGGLIFVIVIYRAARQK